MTSRSNTSKTASHPTHTTHVATADATIHATIEPPVSASPTATPAPHATTTAPTPVGAAPSDAGSEVSPPPAASGPTFIAPPPARATVPSVPSGFEPTNGAGYRGTQPRKSELVALPLAARDLTNFTSYAAVVGTTAPPLVELQQAFGVTNAWSSMRNASSAWDAYARDQEGIAWQAMRTLMDRLKPAFDLAVRANPSIATTYAGLAALLGAKTASAKKAVATRKKNKQDAAEGKEPTAGAIGKRNEKRAAVAALAAQRAAQASASTPVVSAPVVARPV